MRKIQFLAFCLIIIQAIPSLADMGFLLNTDSRVPETVRKSAQAVYYIDSSAGDFETVQTTDVAYEKSIQDDAHFWQKAQFESCVLAKQTTCHIFKKEGEGSAFVFHDAHTLVTVLHNIIEQVSANFKSGSAQKSIQDGFRNLNDMSLFLRLANSNGDPIATSESIVPRLTLVPHISNIMSNGFEVMNTNQFRLADYSEIQFPSQLGSPLALASKAPSVGDTLYLVGFPDETHDRGQFGKPDSDGQHQYVSIGKMISYDNFRTATANSIAPIEANLVSYFSQDMIFADFDCEHGNSGGPILNQNGEVVGVLGAMYNKVGQRICVGIKMLDHQTLQSLWQKIDN